MAAEDARASGPTPKTTALPCGACRTASASVCSWISSFRVISFSSSPQNQTFPPPPISELEVADTLGISASTAFSQAGPSTSGYGPPRARTSSDAVSMYGDI